MSSASLPARAAVKKVTDVRYFEEEDILIFQLADGSTVVTKSTKLREALRRCSVGLIPASSGTFLLDSTVSEDTVKIRKTAVIAWSFGCDGYPEPITLSGPRLPSDPLPSILHPDGSVDTPFEHYDSYDKCLEAIRLKYPPKRRSRGAGRSRPVPP